MGGYSSGLLLSVTGSLWPAKMALEKKEVPLERSIQEHRNEIRALDMSIIYRDAISGSRTVSDTDVGKMQTHSM